MKTSKEIVQKAGIVPKLKLAIRSIGTNGKASVKGTGQHKVKMIEDKVINAVHKESGMAIHKVRYYVEEDGEKKMYEVPMHAITKQPDESWAKGEVHYLVQALADVQEGEEIVMEYKRAGVKGYIEITRNGEIDKVEDDDHDEDDGSDNSGFMSAEEK